MSFKFLVFSLYASLILYITTYVFNDFYIASNIGVLFVNLFQLFFFYLVLFGVHYRRWSSEKKLILVVGYTSFLFVCLYDYLYWMHTGRIFEFTGSDSFFYHQKAIIALNYNFIEGINNFLITTPFGIDDSGMIIYLSLLYRLIENPFFPRLVNIIINVFTALFIFRIAKHYVRANYAMILTLLFSISSYTLYYTSSGLKEPVFILFVVLSFYNYFRYINRGKLKYAFYIIICTLVLGLFRLPVLVFTFLSIISVEIYRKGFTKRKVILIISALVAGIYISITNFDKISHYIYLSNSIYQNSSFGSDLFIKSVSAVAGFFGPFPTLLPISGYEASSIWAAGLIIKSFLSIYFIASIYYVLKRDDYFLKAILTMCLLHIFSLIVITWTFKLRYILPYLPFFFILAGYAYQQAHKKKSNFRVFVACCNLIVMATIFFWNILRL